MRRVRQRARLGDRAERARELERRLEALQHLGLEPLAGELGGHADAARPARSPREGSATGSGKAIEVASQRVARRRSSSENSSAASVTSRVIGPAWSSEEAKAIIP